MDVKPFTDAHQVIRDLLGDLMTLASVRKHERERFLKVLDETFTLLDAALTLPILRLGDLLDLAAGMDQTVFATELHKLDSIDEG